MIAGDTNLSRKKICCEPWFHRNYCPGNKIEKLCQVVKEGQQGQASWSNNNDNNNC